MSKIILKNARLSFPSLFATEQYNGQDTGKFAATFLVPKDSKEAKAIKKAIKSAIELKFGKDAPKKLKSCVKDGDEVDYDGYDGMMAIKANTKKRPVLLNKDKSPITEEDDILYAGCYVNVSLEVYGLDNQYGKRVSCQLNGIQFAKDGESFGQSNDTMGDFDAVDDDDDGENPFD